MNLDAASREEIEALLQWYVAMGVDIAVDPVAHDRFAAPLPVEPGAEQPTLPDAGPGPEKPEGLRATGLLRRGTPAPPRAGLEAAALSADAAVRSAREVAGEARTLDELKAVLEGFEGCSLKGSATQLVFADGNPAARIMAVGEAPGADEDRRGLPFVGRSGQLLDRMLKSIGLDRTSVYIANVVPWRPPGNRTPTPQEVATCMPFIARQIALLDPDVLLCLGGAAAQALLGTRDGILKLRGRWFDFETGPRTIKAMPMLHPAYLLRTPAHKSLAWRDLRTLRKHLDAQSARDQATPT